MQPPPPSYLAPRIPIGDANLSRCGRSRHDGGSKDEPHEVLDVELVASHAERKLQLHGSDIETNVRRPFYEGDEATTIVDVGDPVRPRFAVPLHPEAASCVEEQRAQGWFSAWHLERQLPPCVGSLLFEGLRRV